MWHANVDKIIHLYLVWHTKKKIKIKQKQQYNNGINWNWGDEYKEIARIKKKKLSLYACRVRLAPQATLFCAQYDFATETLDGFISLVMRASAFSHFRYIEILYWVWVSSIYEYNTRFYNLSALLIIFFVFLVSSEEIDTSVDIWNDHSQCHTLRNPCLDGECKRTGKISKQTENQRSYTINCLIWLGVALDCLRQ